MQSDSKPYVPFSQRTGLEPIPPQLKLGEVSAELRRLIDYCVSLEIDRETRSHPYSTQPAWLEKSWNRVAMDLHVHLFRQPIATFPVGAARNRERICKVIEQRDIGGLFDLVEFLVRHRGCSDELKRELADAFIKARAAYRVFDNNHIAAIGTEQQAMAFERAIADAEAKNATAARKQLIAAGVALRNGDWAGSVRESIHAVEAVAVRFAPGTSTLGVALKVLEQRGHLHGGLKTAFGALYGYTSDEEGVRHALVFGNEAQVDEADALFMLGACASFVSYLLSRGA
jgi:AbiJ N-terminal domain 4